MVVCDFHLCNKIKKSHTILYRPLEVLDSTLRTSALHYVMNMGCVCVCVCQHNVHFCLCPDWLKCPVLTWTTWSSLEACCPMLPSSFLAWTAPLSQTKRSRPCALWVVTVLLATSVFWHEQVQPNVIKEQFHLHSPYTGILYNAELPFRWFWQVVLLLVVGTWRLQPLFN